MGLAALWLALLVVLFCCCDRNSGVTAYVLLGAVVGLRRATLICRDAGRSVIFALALGGAIHFGPLAGGLSGALAALGWSTGSSGEPLSRLPRALAVGSAAGVLSGLAVTYAGIGGEAFCMRTHSPLLLHSGLILTVLLVIAESSRFGSRGFGSWIPLAWSVLGLELLAGSALVTGVRLLGGVEQSGLGPMLIPIAYFARQAIADLTSHEYLDAHGRDGRQRLSDTLQSLVSAIDAREGIEGDHASRVVEVSVAIGRRLGMSAAELEDMRTASILRDVGKLWIPEHILLRPGRLAPGQRDRIQNHSEIGQKIVDGAKLLPAIGRMIRSHHERWDGNGYPDRLKGVEIPLGARIIGLSDTYDAITASRAYRAGRSANEALEYIRDSAGTHFDPVVVEAFERVIASGELSDLLSSGSSSIQAGDPIDRDTRLTGFARDGSEFVAMFEIAQAATSTLNLDELLHVVMEKLREMIPCVKCTVYLSESGDEIRAVASVAGDDEIAGGGDLFDPDRQIADGIYSDGLIAVPLSWGGEINGVLELTRSEPDRFSRTDFELLHVIAPQVSLALRNATAFKETSDSAHTDALTGLYNFRFLFARLEEELQRADRLGLSLTLLALDLDNFKAINDNFGHQYGDRVLRDVAGVLVDLVRDYDIVCRYGGDEFVVVLPETGMQEGVETSRRIARAVDAMQPYTEDDTSVKIGVSIGMAVYPNDAADLKTLLSVADSGMYADKNRRKSRPRAA